jgi:hypothetical protein
MTADNSIEYGNKRARVNGVLSQLEKEMDDPETFFDGLLYNYFEMRAFMMEDRGRSEFDIMDQELAVRKDITGVEDNDICDACLEKEIEENQKRDLFQGIDNEVEDSFRRDGNNE